MAKNPQKTHQKKLDHVVSSIDRVYPSLPKLMGRSFLMGLATSLGATVGVTIILGILAYVLQQMRIIPYLGDIIPQDTIERLIPDKR